MGRFDCEYHGVSGMIFACPHIRESIDRREGLPKTVRIAFVDEHETDGRYRFHGGLDYCSICAAERGFASEFTQEPSESYHSFYDKELFQPACFECFSELRQEPGQ